MDKTNIKEEDLDKLTLRENWDPSKITLRLMNGEYDILVEDMLNEPIEIYKMQAPKVLGARGKSGNISSSMDKREAKGTAQGKRIDKTDPNDDNQTATKPKIKETKGGLEQLNANLDAEAIKQIILNSVFTLDVEQQTEAKAMACWNQLARDLTGVRFTDNKHEGLSIEEEEINCSIKKISPRDKE
jgi:hypothetical protein